MHSEIRRSGPESCPLCGMALEPLVASFEAEDTSELREMTRCLRVSVMLILATAALAARQRPGRSGH